MCSIEIKKTIDGNIAIEYAKVEYEKSEDVPECKLYYINNPDIGEEYDCGYDGVDWFCEECLCNWAMGGWKDPRYPEKSKEE